MAKWIVRPNTTVYEFPLLSLWQVQRFSILSNKTLLALSQFGFFLWANCCLLLFFSLSPSLGHECCPRRHSLPENLAIANLASERASLWRRREGQRKGWRERDEGKGRERQWGMEKMPGDVPFGHPFCFAASPLHLRLEKCFTRHLKTAFLLFLTNDRSARLASFPVTSGWMNKGCVSVCTCVWRLKVRERSREKGMLMPLTPGTGPQVALHSASSSFLSFFLASDLSTSS